MLWKRKKVCFTGVLWELQMRCQDWLQKKRTFLQPSRWWRRNKRVAGWRIWCSIVGFLYLVKWGITGWLVWLIDRPMHKFTLEEDFILGAMVGYNIEMQCERLWKKMKFAWDLVRISFKRRSRTIIRLLLYIIRNENPFIGLLRSCVYFLSSVRPPRYNTDKNLVTGRKCQGSAFRYPVHIEISSWQFPP